MTKLPEGRAGQALALSLLALALALVWIAVCLPVMGWYGARNAVLAEDAVEIAHLTALRAQLPALRAAAAATPSPDAGLLPGATDDLAAANLQGAVQDLARAAGLTIESAEALPPVAAGPLRRIGLSVTLNATWPAFIGLLAALAAHPGMAADNIVIAAAAAPDAPQDVALNISFAVYGFRS
jgi:general secretion pathway protein M